MKEYDFTKPENEHLIHKAIDFFIRETLQHYPNLSEEVAKNFIFFGAEYPALKGGDECAQII